MKKAIKAASDSFRKNPNFNTAEVISTLKTGEALISLQNEDGEPTIVDKYIIVPPQSMIGTITDIERDNYIKSTWLYGKYEEKLNLTSTKDILNEKLKKEKEEPLKKTRAKAKNQQWKKQQKELLLTQLHHLEENLVTHYLKIYSNKRHYKRAKRLFLH